VGFGFRAEFLTGREDAWPERAACGHYRKFPSRVNLTLIRSGIRFEADYRCLRPFKSSIRNRLSQFRPKLPLPGFQINYAQLLSKYRERRTQYFLYQLVSYAFFLKSHRTPDLGINIEGCYFSRDVRCELSVRFCAINPLAVFFQ